MHRKLLRHLKKTTMEILYLEKIYFKKTTPESNKNCEKQKIDCSKLYKKKRKKIFLSGRNSNISINYLHERTLKVVYNDNQSSFEHLPSKYFSVCIYHRNIH